MHMSAAGSDKTQRVVNISFWIDPDKGEHMCDMAEGL